MKYLETRLYEARADIGDPRLKVLSLRITPDGKEILIFHNPNAVLT